MFNEQRNARRYPVPADRSQATICIDGAALAAQVEDVSASGFGMTVFVDQQTAEQSELKIGSSLPMQSTDGWHEVSVRHFRWQGESCRIGVQRLRDISPPKLTDETRNNVKDGWKPDSSSALRNGIILTVLFLAMLPVLIRQLGFDFADDFQSTFGLDSVLGRADGNKAKGTDDGKPKDLLARRKARERRAVMRLLGTDKVSWAKVAKSLELNPSQSNELLAMLGGPLEQNESAANVRLATTEEVLASLEDHQQQKLRAMLKVARG